MDGVRNMKMKEQGMQVSEMPNLWVAGSQIIAAFIFPILFYFFTVRWLNASDPYAFDMCLHFAAF